VRASRRSGGAAWLCSFTLTVTGCGGHAERALAPPSAPAKPSGRAAGAERVLAPYLAGGWVFGASLAFVDAHGVEFVNVGTLDGKQAPPREDTFYEIGSLTKTFTGLLLAEMVEKRYVTLEQTLRASLPDARLPEDVGNVTLLELATHRSGLPRVPSNLESADVNNPYLGYDADRLYAYLAGAKLTSIPGTLYAYSNLGFGLLGFVLASRLRVPYEAALELLVCSPAGLRETRVTLAPAETPRLAPPYDADLSPAENWTLGVLEGAGALHSTARDLARYEQLLLGTLHSPLDAALREQLLARADGSDGSRASLGWIVRRDGTLSHSGLTGGYASELLVDRARGVAVVLLTNAGLNVGVRDLGNALLELARGREPSVPSLPREVRVRPETLAEYTGSYPLSRERAFTLALAGGHLVVEVPGERPILLYPEAGGGFFAKLLELRVRFERGPSGLVMVSKEDGREIRRPRLGPAAPP